MKSYESLTTTIEYDESRTEVSLKRGVKQGDPHSPFIFKAIVDPLLEQFEQMKGYMIDESHSILELAFADDLILLANTKDKAQKLLNQNESYLNNLRMRLRLRNVHRLKSVAGRIRGMSPIRTYACQTAIRSTTQQQIVQCAIWGATSLHGLDCATMTLGLNLTPHLNDVGVLS